MIYVSEWERLSDAVTRIMEMWALSKDEVQTDISRAIADRAIKVQAKLKRHATNGFTASGTVLKGTDFQIRPNLTAQDFDWEGSRPLQPWLVLRSKRCRQPGYWVLEWLEVSRTDVTRAFGTAGQPRGATERASDARAVTSTSRPPPNSNQTPVGPDQPDTAGSARRRGARPKKFEQARDAMRSDIQQGRRTAAELETMLEKNLSEVYGVSRDTARRARQAVLSELGEIEFSTNSDKRQMATEKKSP